MADKGKKKTCGFLCKLVKVVAVALVPIAAPVILAFDDEITQVIGQEEEPGESGSDQVLKQRLQPTSFNGSIGAARKLTPTHF